MPHIKSITHADGMVEIAVLDVVLDYEVGRYFKGVLLSHKRGTRISINLERVEHIDSSGIGLLLMIKEHVGSPPVKLIGCREAVMQTIKMSFIDHFFIFE